MEQKISISQIIIIILIFVTATVLFFYNAGNYYLWGDEAETGVYAQNILKFGLPVGFDGRNLHEHRDGLFLNERGINAMMPWLQFYVAAASMTIFGETSFGARALFIFLALAAMAVQYLFVCRFFNNRRLAIINLALIATSVSYILFARQCRYYALVTLLLPMACYLYTKYNRKRNHVLAASLIFFLFLLSNHLLAVTALGGMAFAFFIFVDPKKTLHFFLKPMIITAPLYLAFMFWLQYDGPGNPYVLRNIHPDDFLRIIWIYFKDYNSTQVIPVGILILLLLYWIMDRVRGKKDKYETIKKELAILTLLLFFTVTLSVLTPQLSSNKISDIRYVTAVLPMFLLVQAFVIERVCNFKKWLAGILLCLTITTNIFTFTPFKSYLYKYVVEITHPFYNTVKVAATFIEERLTFEDELIFVIPNDMLATLQFYIGDKVLFCNVISEHNQNLLATGFDLPEYTYSMDVEPDWIVLFGKYTSLDHTKNLANKLLPKREEYREYVFSVPGIDLSRPELNYRYFEQPEGFDDNVRLYIMEHIKRGDGKKKPPGA